jgi:hypothetical protein
MALGAGHARQGALILETETRLSQAELRDLERASHIVSLLVFREQAIVEAEERVHGQLFRELAGGGMLRDHQRLLARARGIDLAASFVAVFARRESGRPLDLAWAMSSLARSCAGLGGEHGSGAGAFLPGTNAEEVARFVHQRLKRELGGRLIVCAAEPQQPLAPDGQMRLAERCAALLHSLGRVDAAVSTNELGLYGILVNPDRSDELATFVHAAVGPLSEHDASYGTALVDTVHAYFREGTNLARTARALYVHPNTVVKRLARVAALLGDDWQSPDRALELHMALQLRSLAEQV